MEFRTGAGLYNLLLICLQALYQPVKQQYRGLVTMTSDFSVIAYATLKPRQSRCFMKSANSEKLKFIRILCAC
jgi:hypothetical protein